MSGNPESAPVLEVLPIYFDPKNWILNSFPCLGWMKEELYRLKGQISFLQVTSSLYGDQQSSDIWSYETQALSQVVDEIWNVGSIEYLDAGWFKCSYESFKKLYRGISKRVSNFHKWRFGKIAFETFVENISHISLNSKAGYSNSTEHVMENKAFVLSTGRTVHFHGLKKGNGLNLIWKKEHFSKDAFWIIFTASWWATRRWNCNSS